MLFLSGFELYSRWVPLLLNEQQMLAFNFCILEQTDLDVVNRGCLVYLNHKNTVC